MTAHGRCLVTGGGGFIGSHLVRALLEAGHPVRVLDDFSTGRRSNLVGLEAEIELIVGSICDPDTVRKATEGAVHVLHQAALPSVARSVEAPLPSHEVNATGTLRLLEAARGAGVQRFVYASSSSVYGTNQQSPKVEDMPINPISPYGITKATAEFYGRVHHQLFGLETVGLRYFNVFGPRQNPTGTYAAVIPRFIRAILTGEPPVILGDGLQTRDFTYVDNVVQANLLALSAPAAPGRVYNIAGGTPVSLLDLLDRLGRITHRHVSPVFQAARPGDIRHSAADLSRATIDLGFCPVITLDEGLERTVAAIRNEA